MQVTPVLNPSSGYTTYMAIAAGETVAEALTIANGSTPVNLTGYTLKMQIEFPTPLLLTTGNGGITLTNAVQGQAQINISDTTSATLPSGSFPYDLWMVSGGGVATRILSGLFTVSQNLAPIP